tara:strand:+ start:200 stop:535 length:336 start_codon:yes stop_codon:yes gene_type:complete
MIDQIDWTKEEFKIFLLIYASQTNFIETEEEIDFIRSRFSNSVIDKIHKDIKGLNDFQKSEIIVNHIKSNDYSQNDLDKILMEIEELYKSDGVFDSMEKSIFSMLTKLLKV